MLELSFSQKNELKTNVLENVQSELTYVL